MSTRSQLKKWHGDEQPLSREEEQRLADMAAEGDPVAREKLIRSITPWAIKLAQRYAADGLDDDDRVQAAMLGVLQAVDKFDPARGCRFTTYAYYRIRREVINAGYAMDIIHIPKAGSYPEDARRAHYIKGGDAVNQIRDVERPCEEVVADAEEAQVRGDEAMELVSNSRARDIFTMRGEGMTLAAIGDVLGICRERVRQIAEEAKREIARKLREKRRNRG